MKKLLLKIKSTTFYKNVYQIITLSGCSYFAPSSLAFFGLLSLFPTIILVALFLSLFRISFNDAISIFNFIFSFDKEITISLNDIINHFKNKNFIPLIISLFIIFYLSSKGVYFFIKQVNNIYQIENNKNYIYTRIKAIFINIVIIILISLFLVFIIFFNYFFRINTIFKNILIYLFILIFIFFAILILNILCINKKIKIKKIIIGSLFSSSIGGIGISFYYYYLNEISNANIYYGPFASFTILFLVFYYFSYICFIGIEINKSLNKNN